MSPNFSKPTPVFSTEKQFCEVDPEVRTVVKIFGALSVVALISFAGLCLGVLLS